VTGWYARGVRPLLFRLGGGDAETAHEATLRALARLSGYPVALAALGRRYRVAEECTVFGLRFANRVGLAAGLDKDGRALPVWPALGFGFVEAGTVTYHPQPGNDRPRLYRLPASGALINRMGFNNAGAAALADRLAALAPARPGATGPVLPVPLGVSIGKSRVTPLAGAVEDYLASLALVRPYADYVAVNVSSPNTPGLRALQDAGALRELLVALRERAGGTPILVKIAPDLTEAAIGQALEVCTDTGVAGVIATNTTLSRTGLAPADTAAGAAAGGLSGAPLTARALAVVTFVARHCDLPVVGVGGVATPADAVRLRDAGASLVQLYTGLVYQGPGLVRATAQALRAARALPAPQPPRAQPGPQRQDQRAPQDPRAPR